MKTIKFIIGLTIALFLTACNGQNRNKGQDTNKNISKIEVLDFHSTHRCMTCNAIEYTLDTYFSNDLKTGKITFQTVNVDEEQNESLAEKFEAAGTALILNVIKNGEESKIDLTEFAFMNGNNKEVFSKALKAKIDTALNKL